MDVLILQRCVVFFIFLFISVTTVWGSSKTASIFLNSILFDGKENLVDAIEKSKFEIPNSCSKVPEKREFLRKIGF